MLNEKVALLTGSVGGIGYASAEALAEAGCNIVLNGIEEEEKGVHCADVLSKKYGVESIYVRADLRKIHEIQDLVGRSNEQFGSVDVVVNNAVVRHFALTEDFSAEDWDDAMSVNLSAAFHIIRLSLPGMKSSGWGRIVNIASVLGTFAMRERVDYVTSKTGLIGLTRAVALETLEFDITCNAVCPGAVLTPASDERIRKLMVAEDLDRAAATKKFLADRQPAGRFVEQASIAKVVSFLCMPFSQDITGVSLPVDAGWSVGR